MTLDVKFHEHAQTNHRLLGSSSKSITDNSADSVFITNLSLGVPAKHIFCKKMNNVKPTKHQAAQFSRKPNTDFPVFQLFGVFLQSCIFWPGWPWAAAVALAFPPFPCPAMMTTIDYDINKLFSSLYSSFNIMIWAGRRFFFG